MTKLFRVARSCLLVLVQFVMCGLNSSSCRRSAQSHKCTALPPEDFGVIRVYIRSKHYAEIMAELQNRRVRGEVSSFVYENKIQWATSSPAESNLIVRRYLACLTTILTLLWSSPNSRRDIIVLNNTCSAVRNILPYMWIFFAEIWISNVVRLNF